MTTIPPSAKPNIAPSEERAKELRARLQLWQDEHPWWTGSDERAKADLLGVIDDRERLEHLHNLDHSLADQWLARAEKAEAQLEKAKSDLIDESKRRAAIAKSLQAHQDQLAKQAPLVEAAMGATLYDSEAPGVTLLEFSELDEEAILRSALALREGKK